MRKLVLLGIVLLAGCQNTVGPLAPRQPQRIDDPAVPTYEQQRRERDRLSLPDQSRYLLPYTDTAVPDTWRR